MSRRMGVFPYIHNVSLVYLKPVANNVELDTMRRSAPH